MRSQSVLASVLRGFLAYLNLERGLSKNTLSSYQRDLEQFVHFLEKRGLASWETVKGEDFSAWIATLRGHEPSSLARKTSAVRTFARYGAREKLFGNFMEAQESPRCHRPLPGQLTPEEVEKLLAAPRLDTPHGLRDRAMLELMYSSGLRVSELCTLQLQAINFEEKYVRVYGKGAKERIVPIGSYAIHALRDYLSAGRPQFVKTKTGSEAFLSQLGRALSRKTFWKIIQTYGRQAGIEKALKPHLLRHSFASHLLMNGADLRVIQEMLGHSSIATTQIYTALNPQHLVQTHNDCHPRNHW